MTAGDDGHAHAVPRAELIGIAARAHRLGFSCWRVAIALEASQTELALIGEQIAAENRHDDQQRVGDPSAEQLSRSGQQRVSRADLDRHDPSS